MTKALVALMLSCASLAVAQAADPQAKKCEDEKIRYAAVDPQYAERMVVEASTDAKPRGDTRDTPQKTRWLQMGATDYSRQGPWTTTIWIGEGDDQTTLKLTLRQHEGFNVEWLNEKLLYGSIAWSKVLSTDFVLDVESHKFVYREMEDATELSEPCE